MKIKIYLAGPLFSDGEIAERISNAKALRKLKNEDGTFIEVFNPIEINESAEKPVDKNFYYKRDRQEINTSNVMIVCLDNMDPGTLVEFGIMLGRKDYQLDPYRTIIIAYYSNWKGIETINKFVAGCIRIECFNGVQTSFEKVISTIELWKDEMR